MSFTTVTKRVLIINITSGELFNQSVKENQRVTPAKISCLKQKTLSLRDTL